MIPQLHASLLLTKDTCVLFPPILCVEFARVDTEAIHSKLRITTYEANQRRITCYVVSPSYIEMMLAKLNKSRVFQSYSKQSNTISCCIF